MRSYVNFTNIKLKKYIPDMIPGITTDKIDAKLSIQSQSINKKYCLANMSNNQTIARTTMVDLSFNDFTSNDTDMGATSGQITISKSGIYMIVAGTNWNDANGGAPIRQTSILVNGSQVVNHNFPALANITNNISIILSLNAGDIIKSQVYHDATNSIIINKERTFLQVVQM